MSNKSTMKSMKKYKHLDGLRGMAILLVVIFHLFVGKVSSGVDVFLFMGGLLFLSSQIKNVTNPNGITLAQSFIRMIRRLFPALVTSVTCAIAFILIYVSPLEWQRYLDDASASLRYIINFRLIEQSADYQSAGAGVSPFQHLWSMSVQFQIYASLILLVYIVGYVLRNKPAHITRFAVNSIVGFLTVLSFIYAAYMVIWGNQADNYYSTLSRFWEIGLGSMLGIIFFNITLPYIARWILSLTGFAIIIATGIVFNGVEHFPGPLTLVPLIGATLIVVSGSNLSEQDGIKEKGIVIWLLETKTMKFFGDISYSLYLWHWTILIFVLMITEDEEYDWWIIRIGVLISSIIIAWISYILVEKPLRQKAKPQRSRVFNISYINQALQSSRGWAYASASILITICMVSIISAPYVYKSYTDARIEKTQEIVASQGGIEGDYPGAKAFLDNILFDSSNPVYPDLLNLDNMLPRTTGDGCFSSFEDNTVIHRKNNGEECAYGDTESNRTMYVVGGSHSEHYMGALDTIGKRNNIKIIPIIKMGCPLYQPTLWNNEDYYDCYGFWSPEVEQYIYDNPPTDGIFMISTRPSTMLGDGPEIVPGYYREVFDRITQAGIPIYAMRDNAWLIKDEKMLDARYCTFDHPDDYNQACGQPSHVNINDVNPAFEAYASMPNIKHMDISESYIKDGWVNVVVGNVLVFRDNHHLTRQFVDTLTDEIERQMKENSWTPGTDIQSINTI